MFFRKIRCAAPLIAGLTLWAGHLPAQPGTALAPAGPEAAPGDTVWGTPPPKPELTSAERARLQAGEILVRDARVDEAGGAGVALAVYHIDAPRLWAVVGDCAANQRFVPGLLQCEVSGETETRAVTRQRLKPYALLPALDYRFETVREPHRWIRIRLLDGDLRDLTGSWRFDPLDEDRLLVTHAIQVHPRYPVPRWLARRTVKQDLAALMACLRWETRAWPDPRQRGLDRQACPEGP